AIGIVLALELLRLMLPAREDGDEATQATQAADGVRATQAADGVRATQAGHGVRATQAGRSLAWCVGAAGTSYLLLLSVLDRRFSVMRNPIEHTRFMLSYASN